MLFISAVLYYSTSIMKSVLPTQAAYISVFITFINVLMTFPPIFLVDRLGRRSLLLISSSMMALTSFILAFSINIGISQVSSLAIVCFVASFSIGLGPIPFVILGEVVPSYAVGAAGSLGLGVNWASNFAVVCTYPSLGLDKYRLNVLTKKNITTFRDFYSYLCETLWPHPMVTVMATYSFSSLSSLP